MLAHPYSTAVLRTLVASVLMHWLWLTNVPHTQFLVSRGSNQKGAVRAPRETLHNVGVLQGEIGLTGTNVPQLDGKIARSRSQDILGGRVEEDLSDFSGSMLKPVAWIPVYEEKRTSSGQSIY